MASYLRLFPKPYVLTPEGVADYKVFHVDPSMPFEDVSQLIESAGADDEIVLKVVLPDLVFPVPFGFRKCDWSAWMVHPLPADELAERSEQPIPALSLPQWLPPLRQMHVRDLPMTLPP